MFVNPLSSTKPSVIRNSDSLRAMNIAESLVILSGSKLGNKPEIRSQEVRKIAGGQTAEQNKRSVQGPPSTLSMELRTCWRWHRASRFGRNRQPSSLHEIQLF